MKMPWGKYNNIDICFLNSGYLKWLITQEWFFMPKKNEDLVVAVEKELKERELSNGHFYEDKVRVEK